MTKTINKPDEKVIAEAKIESLGDLLDRYNAENQWKQLTFIDGVLVTWKIYDRVLKEQLTDENGEPEKDNDGYDYLGIINDDINELLFDQVLNQEYFKTRGYQLMHHFGIDIYMLFG